MFICKVLYLVACTAVTGNTDYYPFYLTLDFDSASSQMQVEFVSMTGILYFCRVHKLWDSGWNFQRNEELEVKSFFSSLKKSLVTAM
jgi:hypothetical protein